MAGTKSGGLKAAARIKLYNPRHYENIGRKGGLVSRGGPFTDREYASRMGAIGGRTSRRKKRDES